MSQDNRIELEPITSPEEWDRQIEKLASAHFLQSSAWGQFKCRYGWHSECWRILDGTIPVAYACVLSRSLGLLRLAYVPRGPLLVRPDERSLSLAATALSGLAQQRQYLLLKADPEMWDDTREWATRLLRQQRWQPGEQVQFRNTVTVELQVPEEELLARMKPKTRYNIGLAKRRGVTVGSSTSVQALDDLYSLYVETACRDGFIVRPRAYYQSLWTSLLERNMATVLLARHDNKVLAGLVVVAFGRTAWYLHGASSNYGRNLMPTYLLQWHAMQWARERGCERYDLWGAPETQNEDDPMAGVLRFKLGFGGVFHQGLGAWDYAPSARLYRLYRFTAPRLLSLGQWLRQHTQQYE